MLIPFRNYKECTLQFIHSFIVPTLIVFMPHILVACLNELLCYLHLGGEKRRPWCNVRTDYGWSITDIASWKWHHRVFTSLNTFCVCPRRQRTDTRRNQVLWNVVLIRILTHLILDVHFHLLLTPTSMTTWLIAKCCGIKMWCKTIAKKWNTL